MSAYVSALVALLTEMKGWLLGTVATITVVMIIINGINYQHGNSSQKVQAVDNIKSTLKMGGGIFALAALALYVIQKFSAIK